MRVIDSASAIDSAIQNANNRLRAIIEALICAPSLWFIGLAKNIMRCTNGAVNL